MTMNATIADNWKSAAAEMLSENQSMEQTEKAFRDQAYVQVQNKVKPFMVPEHMVGFEIVQKNDNNTRMVGIFIFRTGKKLIFAPVFFLNGSIKGTDLLYRVDEEKFCPATTEYCNYLKSLHQTAEGRGVDPKMRQSVRNHINLDDIVEPPDYNNNQPVKWSSTDIKADGAWTDPEVNVFAKFAAHDWANRSEDASILRRFITEDGGQDAIDLLVNNAQHDIKFANALCVASQPDNFMPVLPIGGTKAESLLTIKTNPLRNSAVKSASEDEIRKGYVVEDLRKDANINEVVYMDDPEYIQTCNECGYWKVLMADGSMSDCLVGFKAPADKEICATSGMCEGDVDCWVAETQQDRVVVELSSKKSRCVYDDKVYGNLVSYRLEDGEGHVEKPSAGKSYRMLDCKHNTITNPFHVESVGTTETGLTEVTTDDGKTFLLNPELDHCDYQSSVFGNCARFVEIAETGDSKAEWRRYDTGIELGNRAAINEWFYANGYKKASVHKNGDEYTVMTPRTGEKWANASTRESALFRLMLDCSVREDVADSMLKAAEESKDRHIEFRFVDHNELQLKKEAYNLSFQDWPDWETSLNSTYGVAEEPYVKNLLQVTRRDPEPQYHRVGDKMTFSATNEDLATKTPMELFELSQQKGTENLFEHGVVGELVNMYDSLAMFDKYLPDLERALDRLGRLIFLFYWKPEDYVAAYGSDDQGKLENQLISTFKAFGQLILELSQKRQLRVNQNAMQ